MNGLDTVIGTITARAPFVAKKRQTRTSSLALAYFMLVFKLATVFPTISSDQIPTFPRQDESHSSGPATRRDGCGSPG